MIRHHEIREKSKKVCCRLLGGPFDGQSTLTTMTKFSKRGRGHEPTKTRSPFVVLTKYLPADLQAGNHDNGHLYRSQFPWHGHQEMDLIYMGTIASQRCESKLVG